MYSFRTELISKLAIWLVKIRYYVNYFAYRRGVPTSSQENTPTIDDQIYDAVYRHLDAIY